MCYLLQFLWAPDFSGGKFYLFQTQKLLHMITSCLHHPIIHKHDKNQTLIQAASWSFCWGNIRTQLRWCNFRYFRGWFVCLGFLNLDKQLGFSLKSFSCNASNLSNSGRVHRTQRGFTPSTVSSGRVIASDGDHQVTNLIPLLKIRSVF